MTAASLGDIVAALGGELRGDPARVVERIGPLDSADAATIGFVAQPRYRELLGRTGAGAVIVAPALADAAPSGCALVVTPDPYLYYARLTQWWAARTRAPAAAGVHPSAVVEAGAAVHPAARVEAFAFVGDGAALGEGAVVGVHSHVGRGAVIGTRTRLVARVHVGDGCRLGARCVVHPGVVIGADGFGFAPHEGRWEKIEQLGAVRIGDDVEIGANTCIDRGALDDTVIDDGVKLDNLIQVAHNVRIGAHTAIAACVGIAGSTRIGARCTIAGAAMIAGHIEIADDVHVSGGTVVMASLRTPGRYTGVFPLDDHAAWEKNAATLRQLHRLRERLRALEKKIG